MSPALGSLVERLRQLRPRRQVAPADEAVLPANVHPPGAGRCDAAAAGLGVPRRRPSSFGDDRLRELDHPVEFLVLVLPYGVGPLELDGEKPGLAQVMRFLADLLGQPFGLAAWVTVPTPARPVAGFDDDVADRTAAPGVAWVAAS